MTTATAPLSIDTFKTFFRRADVKAAQRSLASATRIAESTRKHVDGYIVPLLDTFNLTVDRETSRKELRGTKITNPDHLYLSTNEKECARFYDACDVAHKAHGYTVKPGYCPALITATEQTDAENALIRLIGEVMPAFKKGIYGEKRAELLALLMNPPRG